MKLISQTILDDVNGDCLPCCLSMITRIPLRKIPNFCAGNNRNWWAECMDWLASKNWISLLVRLEASARGLVDLTAFQKTGHPLIAINGSHAVVMRDGHQYDPHPSRLGIQQWDGVIILFPVDSFPRGS